MVTGNRQKVELQLGETAQLKLLKDKCFEGTNSFGPYYLYSVEHEGEEKAFFSTADIHQKILEAGLRTGDEFLIRKVPVQNGKKVTARVEFAVVSKQKEHPASPNGANGEMHYRETMETCLRDAVSATQAVNAVTWTTENITSIALTMFIQRARAN